MKTVSCWTLSPSDLDPNAPGMPFESYSLFKHGDLRAAHRFGAALVAKLVEQCPDLREFREIVLPVAYLDVVPACYLLAESVVEHLREFWPETTVRIVRVSKDSVTASNYAAASLAQRRAELESIRFTLDEPIDSDAAVIVIDDVRVTGLAEEFILAALDEAGVSREAITLAYLVMLDAELAQRPETESVLNRWSVTSILDMLPAIHAGHWALTIRYLKDVLASDDLEEFARQVPEDVRREMVAAAHRTGPDFVARYLDALSTLER